MEKKEKKRKEKIRKEKKRKEKKRKEKKRKEKKRIGKETLIMHSGGEFKKQSNNHGGVLEPRNTPQAFSHFTWEHTKHSLIVVDLQGELYFSSLLFPI